MKLKGLNVTGQALIRVKKWSYKDASGIGSKLEIVGYQQTPVGVREIVSKMPYMMADDLLVKLGLKDPTQEFVLYLDISKAEIFVDDSGKAHLALQEFKLIEETVPSIKK